MLDVLLVLFCGLVKVQGNSWQVDLGVLLKIPRVLTLDIDDFTFDPHNFANQVTISNINQLPLLDRKRL